MQTVLTSLWLKSFLTYFLVDYVAFDMSASEVNEQRHLFQQAIAEEKPRVSALSRFIGTTISNSFGEFSTSKLKIIYLYLHFRSQNIRANMNMNSLQSYETNNTPWQNVRSAMYSYPAPIHVNRLSSLWSIRI